MPDMLLAGCDFSGAKTLPNSTWLATGNLTNLGLDVRSLTNCGSHALAGTLNKLDGLKALGLDFPFSLPFVFLQDLAKHREKGEFQSWQEVAEHLAFLSFDQFEEQIIAFNAEPKRVTILRCTGLPKARFIV